MLVLETNRSLAIGGALGIGEWNFASAAREDLIEITGTEGAVRFSCFNNEPIVLSSAGELSKAVLPSNLHDWLTPLIVLAEGDTVELGGLDVSPHVHLPLVESMSKDLLRYFEQRR
jgi:hypothetical protein